MLLRSLLTGLLGTYTPQSLVPVAAAIAPDVFALRWHAARPSAQLEKVAAFMTGQIEVALCCIFSAAGLPPHCISLMTPAATSGVRQPWFDPGLCRARQEQLFAELAYAAAAIHAKGVQCHQHDMLG
jgi:hypothetical protein